MVNKIKDFFLTISTVIVALSLSFFTQNKLPMLDFLTTGKSLVAWGYFLIIYLFYFYLIFKVGYYIRILYRY